MINKKFLSISLLAAVLIFFIYFLSTVKPGPLPASRDKSGLIKVTASFYPLYFLADFIGQDKVEVINLTPSGAEPHDYELTTRDIINVKNSRILIVNGSGFEPWLDKLEDELVSNQVQIISVLKKLKINKLSDNETLANDPHVWLDPVLTKEIAALISTELINMDPLNQPFYQSNLDQLNIKLDQLDNEFKAGLSKCNQKNIIVSHAAFGYLTNRYNLNQIYISGLTPEEEPTAANMVKITKIAKDNGIRYIFYESLISSRLSESIASEVGAQTLVLNPIEGLTRDEEIKTEDYFSLQRQNLKNLKLALNCL